MMTSVWTSKRNRFYYASRCTGSPKRHRTPRGRATAPRLSHTALGAPGERRGAAIELGERGVWEGALPGTACSVPGKGRDPGEGRGFNTFRGHFPSGIFFCVSVLGIPFDGSRSVSGDGALSPPSRVFFVALIFGSAVERLTLNALVPGSRPTFSSVFCCFFNCTRYGFLV